MMNDNQSKKISKSRKRFYSFFIVMVAFVGISIFFISSQKQNDNIFLDGGFVLGKDYERVSDSSEYNDGNVHITEFFSYSCPHCRAIDNNVDDWVSRFPENIFFKKEHPSFNYNMSVQSKTFYALKDLDLESKYHKKIMEILSQYSIGSSEEMALVFEEKDRKSFLESYFNVNSNIEKANKDLRKYSLIGVPSFVINGEFVTGPQYIKDPNKLYDLFISFNKYYQKNKK